MVAPAGFLLVVIGLSLLLERLIDQPVSWSIRPALGLAVAIFLTQVATEADATAELAVPMVVVLAILGLVFGSGFVSRPPSWVGVGVVAAVFLVHAAPVLFSGEATWAGYIKLDDTATWLALTDHAFEFGRDGNLTASSHGVIVNDYLSASYPMGAFTPTAVMGGITGQDIAWTIQPSMAFAAAVLASLLYGLVRPLVRADWTAAAIAGVASISSILIGYALWGGTKELVAAAMLPLFPSVLLLAVQRDWPTALAVPLGLSLAAVISVLGLGGAVFLAPMVAAAVYLVVVQIGLERAARLAGWTALAGAVFVLPVLVTPTGFFNPVLKVLTIESELGNLTGPLNILHLAGLWPSTDFRFDPHLKPLVYVLAVLLFACAAGALAACVRRGDGKGVPFAAYAGGGVLGLVAIMLVGSPWVDAKGMATISPAVLAAAMLGIAFIRERTPFETEGTVLGAIVIAVAVWSAFLAYQGVWLAPRDHYTEQERIAERFEGEGPAISDEVSIYGPRHFLRKLELEGASDRRSRPVFLVGGRLSGDSERVDLDQIQADQFAPYKLVVTRRGPTQSRPSAAFELAYSGDRYLVWERTANPEVSGALVEHLGLGDELDAGAVPSCGEVARLAGAAGPGGTLVAADVPEPVTVHIGDGEKPASWGAPTIDTIAPDSSGDLTADFEVPAGGDYEVWLSGAVYGKVELEIDGRDAGSERGVINNLGGYEPMSILDLAPGPHTVELHYAGAGIAPGSAVKPFGVGPLILEPVGPTERGLLTVPSAGYAQLCERRWDWIEAYAG